MTVSETLRSAILADGRNVCELARLAGVDHGILSRFLAQRRGMNLVTADRLCEALNFRLVRGRQSGVQRGRKAKGG